MNKKMVQNNNRRSVEKDSKGLCQTGYTGKVITISYISVPSDQHVLGPQKLFLNIKLRYL